MSDHPHRSGDRTYLSPAVFHKYDALNESVEENVTGMAWFKSYVREDYEKQKFAVAAQDVCAHFTVQRSCSPSTTP